MQDDDFNPCHIEAHEIIATASDYLLRMAASGQIDLNALARFELRGRLWHEATRQIIAMAQTP